MIPLKHGEIDYKVEVVCNNQNEIMVLSESVVEKMNNGEYAIRVFMELEDTN